MRQKQIISKPRFGNRICRLEQVSVHLKLPGYFFHAARKGHDVGLLEITFGRIKKSYLRLVKMAVPHRNMAKISKIGVFQDFSIRAFKSLEKKFRIYGFLGSFTRVGAKIAHICFKGNFARSPI